MTKIITGMMEQLLVSKQHPNPGLRYKNCTMSLVETTEMPLTKNTKKSSSRN